MKSFRTILSEVAEPKADDEKNFKDKHIVVKKNHPVAPDHVFTGKIGKAPKRLADYDKGEDELVYEGSFDVPTAEGGEYDEEESHKKYKKGNKSKDLRREEAENLDEISRDLARSYIRKASDQFHGEKNRLKLGDKAKKRSAGITMAGKKAYSIPSEPRVRATESVEQIDELSKKTLSSYTRKAASSMGTAAHDLGQKKAAADEVDRMTNRNMPNKYAVRDQMKKALGADHDAQSKDQNTIGKRLKGIDRATARLAKEETELEEKLVGGQKKLDHNKNGKIDAHDFHLMRKKKMKEEAEQLDELSPNTLKSYAAKSYNQANTLAKQSLSDQPKSVQKASTAAFKRRSAGIKAAARRLGSDEMKKIHKDVVGESVEQLDELSPNTLHSYIKKAAGNLAGNAAVAAAQASSSMKKSSPDVKRNIRNRMRGITGASGRLADKANASMYEEAELDEAVNVKGIQKAVDDGKSMDVILGMFANKRTTNTDEIRKVVQDYKWNKWKKKEEVELDESITKMSSARLKFHATKKIPHGSFSNAEIEDEHDRRKKTDPNYHGVKPSLSEVTQSAVKKTVTYTGSDGKSHARNVPIKRIDRDEHGQEKIRESVELDEAFKVGMIKLNDGGSVILKKEDVDVLNGLFNSLSSTNRKKMESTAMKDKNGFNEILSFAREAM